MQKIEYLVIGCNELMHLIAKVYDLPSRFEILEVPNDSSYTFNGLIEEFISDEREECAELIAAGSACMWEIGVVIRCLIADGHIEQVPNVLIKVFW